LGRERERGQFTRHLSAGHVSVMGISSVRW
jgi:hypothetical protein